MSKEMKALINQIIKYDITFGSIIALIIWILVDIRLASIFFLGLLVATINFIVSGIILEKSLISSSWIKSIMFPFTYLIRIMVIAIIAIPLMNSFKDIAAYICGFIIHFPILMFSWFRRQKGSE